MTTYTKLNDLEGEKLVEPVGQEAFSVIDTVQGIESDINGLTEAIEKAEAQLAIDQATLTNRQEDLIGLRACGVISIAEKAEADNLIEE